MRTWVLAVLLAFAVGCSPATAPPMTPQSPSPMEEDVRAHQRLDPAGAFGELRTVSGVLPNPVEVSVRSGRGLLVHFHGASYVPFSVEGPAVVAAVNLGAGSSAYERPFTDAHVFTDLLAAIAESAGTAEDEVTLAAFSAGYGAVRAILRQHPDLVHRVILLDGLHTDYIPSGVTLHDGGSLNSEKMRPFLAFARRAVAGEKAMLYSHSAIFPGTYASTTETASYLLSELGLKREAVLEWGPMGMQLLSRAAQGQFVVLGYAGNTAPDHIDHLHALPQFWAYP